MSFEFPKVISGYKNLETKFDYQFEFDGDTNIKKIVPPEILQEKNYLDEMIAIIISPFLADLIYAKDIITVDYVENKVKYKKTYSHVEGSILNLKYERIYNGKEN